MKSETNRIKNWYSYISGNLIEYLALIIWIFFGLMLLNISQEGIDQNIVSAVGVILGISIAIWHHERNDRRKQESLIEALSLLLLQFFQVSEGIKDSFLWSNRETLQNTSLSYYVRSQSKTEIQMVMKNDIFLLSSLRKYLDNRAFPSILTGFPLFSFGSFEIETYFNSLNTKVNGIKTTFLKNSLINLKLKIDLCNKYINSTEINVIDDQTIFEMQSNFIRLLNALIDLDKYVKICLIDLNKFGFIGRFNDLQNDSRYKTIISRNTNF